MSLNLISVFIILVNQKFKHEKVLLLLIFTAALNNSAYSQNASTFSHLQPVINGFTKIRRLIRLIILRQDLLLIRLIHLLLFRITKWFIVFRFLSKSGLTSVNQQTPYTDTNHYNFQTTNAYYYLNVLSILGTIPGIDSVAFVNFQVI